MRYVQRAVIALFVVSVLIFGASKATSFFQGNGSSPEIKSSSDVVKVKCDYTKQEILAGLTAYDKEDWNLKDEIMVGSISRFFEYGKSKVTYAVFDSSNRSATYTRTVVFEDYTSPEITLTNPLVIKVNDFVDEKNLIGATDVFDGDISSRVRITKNNINYNIAGTYSIGVEVTNSFGDVVKQELPVHIVTDPETLVDIDLKQNVLYLEKGQKFAPEKYVKRATSFYGKPMDVAAVQAFSNVNVNKAGCYEVEYRATDETGNTGVTYMIVIVTEKGGVK